MGKLLSALAKWLLGHPEVVQAVVSAVKDHEAKK